MSTLRPGQRPDVTSLTRLQDALAAAADKYVVVGVPSSQSPRKEDGPNNATIAAVHEFGAPGKGIPERSFARTSLAGNSEKYTALNAKSLDAVAQGNLAPDAALELLGQVAAGDMKTKIVNGPFVALKPETIERKGSDKPLLDTDQMMQSLTYEVRDESA